MFLMHFVGNELTFPAVSMLGPSAREGQLRTAVKEFTPGPIRDEDARGTRDVSTARKKSDFIQFIYVHIHTHSHNNIHMI